MAYSVHVAASAEREYSNALARTAEQFASTHAMAALAGASDAAVKALSVNPYT